MLRTVPFLLLLLRAVSAMANEGGGHHGEAELDEHTIHTIIYQCINVAMIAVGLVYFLRKPVREYFQGKHNSYVHAAEKAMAAQRRAEEERMHVEVQLAKLESTHQESIERAKAEAADLRNALIQEAREFSKRLQQETQAAAQLEIEKAKQALRQQIIQESFVLAQSQIKTAVSSEDHARLNKDFIQNIETAVQS
jgi:F-type H+-transporting ATPase subunit b